MPDVPPSSAPSPALEALRGQIDTLDHQIVSLLNQRAQIVVEVGRVKQQTNAPIYAPEREKIILERVRRLNKGPLPNSCLEAVYRELMSGSFALEKPLKIGFLGPLGTFSHLASVRKFGSSVEHVPLADISSVFEEVVRGHIDYGLVPVENSLHGFAERLAVEHAVARRGRHTMIGKNHQVVFAPADAVDHAANLADARVGATQVA